MRPLPAARLMSFARGVPVTRMLPSLCLVIVWTCAPGVLAQRVQFPTQAPAYTPTPQPTLSEFDPYGNPTLGAPPPNVPYNATPQIAPSVVPGAISPPTTPPAGFSTAQPLAQPGVTQQGGSLFPNGLPYQWESGAYQYQNPDGSVVRLQRLMQQVSFEHTFLYGDGTFDALGWNRTEMAVTFGFPIFYNPDTPLFVTPGFAFNWLEGPITTMPMSPSSPDLPPRLYDAYLDFAWHPQLTQWLSADLGVRTGVWSDFENVTGDSVRIMGRGLGVLSLGPQYDLLLGVWYLDRNRIGLLPAGGIHLRPGPEWDLYLVFPNPKIRKRYFDWGPTQWWWYVAAEYGGGRWTIDRRYGTKDDIDYNDIRVLFGLEWETPTQIRGHVETGFVFDRELRYALTGAPSRFDLDNTFMIRAGIDF